MVAIELWGGAYWRSIHATALGFAERPKELRGSPAVRAAYRAWFAALASVLPCDTCRDQLASHLVHDGLLAELDAALDNHDDPYALFEWTVRLHNRVARGQGKPPDDDRTVERALEEFNRGGGPPGPNAVSIGAHGIALAVGILVALLVVAMGYLSVRACRKML
jgi:hypothetical protein